MIIGYQISNPIDSILFSTLWNNLEFIQNFRQWVRFNLILVPIITIVMAYSINEFLKILYAEYKDKKKIIYLKNPYYKRDTSKKILKNLKKINFNKILYKKFVDIIK